MSSGPKGKRKESSFEAQHNLVILRHEMTKFLLTHFGFSQENLSVNMNKFEDIFNTNKDND